MKRYFFHMTCIAATLWTLLGCQPEAKKATLSDGFAKYEARQLEESESIADRYIANPDAATVAEAYYLRGLTRMTRGNRVGAAEDLHNAIAKTERTDLKSKSWRSLGDIDFDQAKWAEAEKEYQTALSAGGANPATASYLNYRIGVSLQARGEWPSSVAWFGRVVATDSSDPTLKERSLARMHASAYALQFGAFQDAARARELVAQLKAAGLNATIPVDVRDGQLLYLVQSGSFKTMAEVSAAREAVQGKYPLVAIVP